MSWVAAGLSARTVAIDDVGDLIPLLPEPDGVAWVRQGEGLVGWGTAARIGAGAGEDRFERARTALAGQFDALDIDDQVELPGTGPVAFGSFTFDPLADGSVLRVPRVVVGRRDGRSWMTVIGDADAPPPAPGEEPAPHGRVRYAGSSISELAWMAAVDQAVRAIRVGELAKVVLARDRIVWSRGPFDARVLARRLAERFPTCFTFSVDGLVGATPELLVRRIGRHVESRVLAGSIARGSDDEADSRLGAALRDSAKDREEHAHAVASVDSVLGPLCAALEVDPEPWLLRLANVQHLATGLRGELAVDRDALALAGDLHPTAAVCGTPAEAAMARIRSLEGMDRARYSGPVGWVDARGDGEWGIALRCAELDGARARLFAGAGIVEASLPEAELEETRLKLRAMQSAFEHPST